jgi:hypothetical protein
MSLLLRNLETARRALILASDGPSDDHNEEETEYVAPEELFQDVVGHTTCLDEHPCRVRKRPPEERFGSCDSETPDCGIVISGFTSICPSIRLVSNLTVTAGTGR